MITDPSALQALDKLQAPVLFNKLPAVLDGLFWMSVTAGFIIVVAGHCWRMFEAGNEGDRVVREWYKTVLILAFMIISPKLCQWGTEAMQEVQSTRELGNPSVVTRKCVRLAFTFPEIETLLSGFSRAQQTPASSTSESDSVTKAVSEGGIWGYLKAFFLSLGDEASDLSITSRQSFSAVLNGPALVSAWIAGILKATTILVSASLLYFFMMGAGAAAWFVDTLRYLFLSAGSLALPVFIAGYGTRSFSAQAHNYVTGMIAVLLWPIGWIIGHIGTVGLFDAYVSLLSGSSFDPAMNSQAADFIKNFSWDQIDHSVSAGPTSLWGGGALTLGASAPFLWYGLVALGAFGLFLWVFMVSIGGPILVTRLVTKSSGLYLAQNETQRAAQKARAADITSSAISEIRGELITVPYARSGERGGTAALFPAKTLSARAREEASGINVYDEAAATNMSRSVKNAAHALRVTDTSEFSPSAEKSGLDGELKPSKDTSVPAFTFDGGTGALSAQRVRTRVIGSGRRN